MTAEPRPPAANLDRPEEVLVPPILPRLIYYTLRIGVGLAAALILVGLGLLVAGPPGTFASAAAMGASFSWSGLLNGLRAGRPAALLLLGFLVLIVTPLIRVIISMVSFAVAKDRAFTALTLGVLLLLAASVVIGAVA